jgi:alpha-L-rhamnosidase
MYNKWIDDIRDSQNQQTGFVPHTAPFNGGGGGPAWGSSVAVVPWNMYLQYGDKEPLKKSKLAIKKWIEYLTTRAENGIVTHEEGGSWCLGDWCMPSKYPWSEPHLDEIKIPSELVNTIYYIYCMHIYCNILYVLDEEPDKQINEEIIKSSTAVNSIYFDGEYAGGEQGCNVFPLFADIVPEEHKDFVLDKLITRIKKNDFCFDTGISGTKFLLMVLDKYERNDIAIKMLINTKYPSYGNMIKNGATSLWETWEGNGSKNHTAFLSADSWLFYGLAGIKPNGGYKEFSLNPFFAEELDNLNVELECEYGKIGLKWNRNLDGIDVEIKIPFNTTAHINLKGECFDLCAGDYKYYLGG